MFSSIDSVLFEGGMAMSTQLPTTQESMRYKTRINGWLLEEGWRVVTQNSPYASWVLTVQDSQKHNITFTQKHNRPDQIIINVAVDVSESNKYSWYAMEQDARRMFALDLQIALMSVDVEFQAMGPSPEAPEQFIFTQRIYYDGLTKDTFLQRLSWVRRAVSLFSILLNKQFQPTAPQLQPIGFTID